MQELTQALDEMKGLYQRVLGQPAPELGPHSYAPFPIGIDPLQHAQLELQQVKEVVDRMAFAPRSGAWMPPADSFLTKKEFVIRIEVPGVSREELKVFVLGGECVVRGERKTLDFDELRPMAIERPWGMFERRFVLPIGSRIDEMKARVADGMLEVRIPVEGIDVPKEQKVEVA